MLYSPYDILIKLDSKIYFVKRNVIQDKISPIFTFKKNKIYFEHLVYRFVKFDEKQPNYLLNNRLEYAGYNNDEYLRHPITSCLIMKSEITGTEYVINMAKIYIKKNIIMPKYENEYFTIFKYMCGHKIFFNLKTKEILLDDEKIYKLKKLEIIRYNQWMQIILYTGDKLSIYNSGLNNIVLDKQITGIEKITFRSAGILKSRMINNFEDIWKQNYKKYIIDIDGCLINNTIYHRFHLNLRLISKYKNFKLNTGIINMIFIEYMLELR